MSYRVVVGPMWNDAKCQAGQQSKQDKRCNVMMLRDKGMINAAMLWCQESRPKREQSKMMINAAMLWCQDKVHHQRCKCYDVKSQGTTAKDDDKRCNVMMSRDKILSASSKMQCYDAKSQGRTVKDDDKHCNVMLWQEVTHHHIRRSSLSSLWFALRPSNKWINIILFTESLHTKWITTTSAFILTALPWASLFM